MKPMRLQTVLLQTAAATALWISATGLASAASTTTILPPLSTGWSNYSFTFTNDATVTVFLGVNDSPGGGGFSSFDIDNISASGALLTDFTSGALPTGFDLLGSGAIRNDLLNPHGNFERLYSNGGANLSALGGNTGSVLGFTFAGLTGQTFSFDWRFTAGGQNDYAFLNMSIDGGGGTTPVGVQSTLASATGTAPVPVPAAAWLLGSALASMGVFRRRAS